MLPRITVQAVRALTLDPEFEGGSIHTARATMTNPNPDPTAVVQSYTARLYLDVQQVAYYDALFTIPAGDTINVDFPITMPLIAGSYEVWLSIWSGATIAERSPATLLKHYGGPMNTENVTIVVSPAIDVGPITWL